MERRMFFAQGMTLVATGIVASATRALAAPAKKGPAHAHAHGATPGAAALQNTANDCIGKGEVCLSHCFDMMTNGNTTMVECAKSVREMLVYCEALGSAAAQNSKHLKALAKIALEACNDCETQCRKHEKVQACKDCAEACNACAKQCKAFIG